MKLKSRLLPFSVTRIRVSTRFLFFVSKVFYLWVNSDIILWQTRHTGSFLIPCLVSCFLSTNRKILLTSLAKYAISGQSDTEIDLFQIYTGSLGFCFKLIIFVFQKSMQILFTDRALPTIRCMDQILKGENRPKFTVANTFFSSRFRPSLTGLTRLRWNWVCRQIYCWVMRRTPVRHNLFNRCCHFAYGDAAMRLKCVWHSKNAIFTQNFAMSLAPDSYKALFFNQS